MQCLSRYSSPGGAITTKATPIFSASAMSSDFKVKSGPQMRADKSALAGRSRASSWLPTGNRVGYLDPSPLCRVKTSPGHHLSVWPDTTTPQYWDPLLANQRPDPKVEKQTSPSRERNSPRAPSAGSHLFTT